MAAHAACADAALADDRHWDEVASHGPSETNEPAGAPEPAEPAEPADSGRRVGCLTLIVALLIIAALI